MKIRDIFENDKNNNIEDILNTIIEGDYFQTYLKPVYENHLNENSNTEDLRSLSNNNNLTGHVFYHGSEDSLKNANKILSFKYRTVPRDTVPLIHNHINNTSKKLLGEPIRNLFYITNNLGITVEYGDAYIFFPIDHAKFFYHEDINDLTNDLRLTSNILNNPDWLNTTIQQSGIKTDNEARKSLVVFINNIKRYIQNNIEDLSDESLNTIYETMKGYDVHEKYIEGAYFHIKSIFESTRDVLTEYLKEIKTTTSMAEISDDIEVMVKPNRFVLIDIGNEIEDSTDLFYLLGKQYLEQYIKDQV